ncbi:MAG: hypothetical protein K9W46_11310 [Candidatus Heimdallarchaeum endolithica]|uniref:Uncharacterized protein n=1 Tax=Candidatus Heimdallarchaeum endolithica TaxID=2876572 RepID=A0A9Y1BQ26_9ARCH|nr:MAG: hypothetical protein K9W46_11310 [Candidatus Heimdallarchaeum endolithica]
MLIKAIMILKRNGSCRFYRIYHETWSNREIKAALISFISAVTTLTSELGEKIPKKVIFGDNEVFYEPVNDYFLVIVKKRDYYSSIIKKVVKIFRQQFANIKCNSVNDMIEDVKIKEYERKLVSNFARSLNLIVNKRTNIERIKVGNEEIISSFGLVLKDLDILIANEDGQPLYLLMTQSLPYDAVLLVAFISAILNMSQQYGLGDLTEIESEHIIVLIRKIEKAFTIVLTTNKEKIRAYQIFTEFLSNFSNEWIKENENKAIEIFQDYKKKIEFEEVLKLAIDTETWEKHIIKQNEIKAVDELELTF